MGNEESAPGRQESLPRVSEEEYERLEGARYVIFPHLLDPSSPAEEDEGQDETKDEEGKDKSQQPQQQQAVVGHANGEQEAGGEDEDEEKAGPLQKVQFENVAPPAPRPPRAAAPSWQHMVDVLQRDITDLAAFHQGTTLRCTSTFPKRWPIDSRRVRCAACAVVCAAECAVCSAGGDEDGSAAAGGGLQGHLCPGTGVRAALLLHHPPHHPATRPQVPRDTKTHTHAAHARSRRTHRTHVPTLWDRRLPEVFPAEHRLPLLVPNQNGEVTLTQVRRAFTTCLARVRSRMCGVCVCCGVRRTGTMRGGVGFGLHGHVVGAPDGAVAVQVPGLQDPGPLHPQAGTLRRHPPHGPPLL